LVVSGTLLLVSGALSLDPNGFLRGAAKVPSGLANLPAFASLLCWLYWLALFVWKILRSGWRLATRRLAHSH
jgi:hypothetical protein